MKRAFTILQDTREKKPLRFPRHLACLESPAPKRVVTIQLIVSKMELPEGDYCLSGHRDRCIIERKGSIREVATNVLGHDRPRFMRAIDRFANSCSQPILLMEGTPAELLRPCKNVPDPGVALDALLQVLSERRITPLFLPHASSVHRIAVGEVAARMLIAGAMNPCPQTSTSPSDCQPSPR